MVVSLCRRAQRAPRHSWATVPAAAAAAALEGLVSAVALAEAAAAALALGSVLAAGPVQGLRP